MFGERGDMGTKTESFWESRRMVFARREQVLEAIREHPGVSRSEIAKITGLRVSSVCGRVNELIKMNLVVVSGTAWDEETKRNVEAVAAVGSHLQIPQMAQSGAGVDTGVTGVVGGVGVQLDLFGRDSHNVPA